MGRCRGIIVPSKLPPTFGRPRPSLSGSCCVRQLLECLCPRAWEHRERKHYILCEQHSSQRLGIARIALHDTEPFVFDM
jgi:hypothetical protein